MQHDATEGRPLPRQTDPAPCGLHIGSAWSGRDLANFVEIHLPSGFLFRLTAKEGRRTADLLIKHADRVEGPAKEA